jgi:hypothetical protein
MSNIANSEELFRFTSTRAPDPASRPDAALELACDADVPAWLADADGQDVDGELHALSAQWRELTGRDPRSAFSELEADSRRAQVLDLSVYFPTFPMQEYGVALGKLLTSLWKFYLQAIGSGKASTAQLERGHEMIALASMLQAACSDSDAAQAPVSLVRKIRLPAAFEASMQARRALKNGEAGDTGRHLADQRDAALRTQIAELDGLDQLAHRLAAALEQFDPAAAVLAAEPAAGADAADEITHSIRPAENVDGKFWRANSALLQDLQHASIPTAGIQAWQVLDQLRRLVADQVLAVAELPAGPGGAQLIAAHPLLQRLAASAPPLALASAVPAERFGIRPIGIADLRVVRQVLLRYEKGELAHIENVLQGEQRERIHTRIQRVEEGQFDWSERETEHTRDTQSSDFLSMGREARATLREQQDESTGISISATYGDVSISASTFMNNSRSLEQSIAESVWHSRDILSRTADTVRERVGRQRFRNMLSEVQETTIHRQSAEGANVIGQYRWVEKVYQAQVFNYGARAMYEIMLPKPAAMFTHLLAHTGQHGAIAGAAPVKPALRPADITESTWTWFAARHGVSLPPPPPSAMTVYAQAGVGTEDSGLFRPAAHGYQAAWGGCSMSWVGAAGLSGVTASIGPRLFAATAGQDGPVPAQVIGADAGPIGFCASAWGAVQQYSVNFYLVRTRTRRALEQWQQDCYQIIMDDYGSRLGAWREQVAARSGDEAEAALTQGRMRTIERTELKRAILEIVRAGSGSLAPQEVRFFESAFEWDQMTYRFHPYFWNGAPAEWRAGALPQQGDSVFTAFLNAGFASVALPVRPGYEDAAALYLNTGLILELPVAPADQALASMNHEIAQRNGLPGDGVAEGEAWQYRVPTTLVVLDDGIHNRLPVLALDGGARDA